MSASNEGTTVRSFCLDDVDKDNSPEDQVMSLVLILNLGLWPLINILIILLEKTSTAALWYIFRDSYRKIKTNWTYFHNDQKIRMSCKYLINILFNMK